MMTQDQANKLCEASELAFFRVDVCLGSPQSFTLDDKAQRCEHTDATNKAIEDAMKDDFQSLPLKGKRKLTASFDYRQYPTLSN